MVCDGLSLAMNHHEPTKKPVHGSFFASYLVSGPICSCSIDAIFVPPLLHCQVMKQTMNQSDSLVFLIHYLLLPISNQQQKVRDKVEEKHEAFLQDSSWLIIVPSPDTQFKSL